MRYMKRVDLLEDAVKSIRMQERAGIEPVCKCNGKTLLISDLGYAIPSQDIEFPLAVVEGKPVFVGDELYCNTRSVPYKFIPTSYDHKTKLLVADVNWYLSVDGLSWSPPKPETVMVPLLREDAVTMAGYDLPLVATSFRRIAEACAKVVND